MTDTNNMSLKFLTADTITAGGRIYPREEIEKALDQYKEVIKNGASVGEMVPADGPFPDTGAINLANVSHLVKDVRIDDRGDCYAEIEFMGTYSKNQLRTWLESEIVRLAPRGTGMVDEQMSVTDYTILSIDIIPNIKEEDEQ